MQRALLCFCVARTLPRFTNKNSHPLLPSSAFDAHCSIERQHPNNLTFRRKGETTLSAPSPSSPGRGVLRWRPVQRGRMASGETISLLFSFLWSRIRSTLRGPQLCCFRLFCVVSVGAGCTSPAPQVADHVCEKQRTRSRTHAKRPEQGTS